MTIELNSWQDVRAEVLKRIHTQEWRPGDLIPSEIELAQEFGCARATVNRALQAVAEAGLLDRKRKAGTRVAVLPVRKATVNIPVIRHEVEKMGRVYSHALISSETVTPPSVISAQMRLEAQQPILHLQALHLADGRPYAYEDRWINTAFLPKVLEVDFARQSANEWLLANAPFSRGEFGFSASAANVRQAEILDTEVGTALFAADRATWHEETSITLVKLFFAPGYRMQMTV